MKLILIEHGIQTDAATAAGATAYAAVSFVTDVSAAVSRDAAAEAAAPTAAAASMCQCEFHFDFILFWFYAG